MMMTIMEMDEEEMRWTDSTRGAHVEHGDARFATVDLSTEYNEEEVEHSFFAGAFVEDDDDDVEQVCPSSYFRYANCISLCLILSFVRVVLIFMHDHSNVL